MTSTSKIRRLGYNAYYRGGDPKELNPYKLEWDRENWLAGWNKAHATDNFNRLAEQEREAMRTMPIEYAIDNCDASDSVKEVLRRIVEKMNDGRGS